MKRIGSPDSLAPLMSLCPSSEEIEECGEVGEKKRRLSVEQVKALEKQFEEDNKLDPERKAKLAHDLGLHPRQVAVWFQNRRARWKAKILERDYGLLKATYDSLHQNFESLQQQNQTLLNKITELKTKVKEKNKETKVSIKEEEEAKEPHQLNSKAQLATDEFKDGQSDSDSSAILNSEPNSGHQLFNRPDYSIADYNIIGFSGAQLVEMEDHILFSEEVCNFFLEDQAPTLHWYHWT